MTIRKIQANSNAILHRSESLNIDAINEEERTVTFTGSSEYAARRWGYTEILSHEKGAIRTERMNTVAAVLKNHDADQIVAAILSFKIVDKKTVIVARFTTTQGGEDAFTEVKEAALRGVSVGYAVHKWEVNEDEDTYRAIDWEPYEFSFTPIPVDPDVGVGRSADEEKQAFFSSINRSLTKEKPVKPENTQENPVGEPVNAATRSAVTSPSTPAPAIDVDAIRSAAIKAAKEDAAHITRQAESLGLDVSDYIDMERSKASDAMIAAVAERGSKKPIAGVANVSVTEDADDKRSAHFVDKLIKRQSIDVLMELARANGQEIYSRRDLAKAILGNAHTRALETVSSLGAVTVLAADKAMIIGYNSYQSWADKIASVRYVGDFKTVHSAGLTLGAFNVPGEGNAFSDLAMDDFGDTAALAMRGGTLQLTTEAIYNDDLGLFFDAIRNLGRLGHREEDKVLVTALEAATFTNQSLSAAAFSSAALAAAWASFNAITDGNGEKISLDVENILLPSALVVTGLEAVTAAQGEATARIFATGDLALNVVNGRGLSDANDWYLFAGKGDANGLQLLKHHDYETPALEEIDHGSVAARKWMVTYPLGGMINNLKAGAPIGIHKAVVA